LKKEIQYQIVDTLKAQSGYLGSRSSRSRPDIDGLDRIPIKAATASISNRIHIVNLVIDLNLAS
jgi:hypothetical protein